VAFVFLIEKEETTYKVVYFMNAAMIDHVISVGGVKMAAANAWQGYLEARILKGRVRQFRTTTCRR